MTEVLLAAGHGLTPAGRWDPGTTYLDLDEHTENERVLWAAHDHLRAVGFDRFALEAGATRNTNDRLDGNWSAFRSLVNAADDVRLAVEVHHDIATARRGAFAIVPKRVGYDNAREWDAARAIGDAFARARLPRLTDYEDRRGLGLIRRPKFPTLLLEVDRLGDDLTPEDAGTALAEGILDYLGVKPAPVAVPPAEALPILGTGHLTLEQAVAAFTKAKHAAEYPPADLRLILAAYAHTCAVGGLSFDVAVAQVAHETGWLSSWWAGRPRRNPAGIGVTGATYPTRPAVPAAYDPRANVWRAGVSFDRWAPEAVDAHVGRLLGYAIPAGLENREQARLIAIAHAVRPIPRDVRGCAVNARDLGRDDNPRRVGWAVPGKGYGAALAKRIATIAKEPRA